MSWQIPQDAYRPLQQLEEELRSVLPTLKGDIKEKAQKIIKRLEQPSEVKKIARELLEKNPHIAFDSTQLEIAVSALTYQLIKKEGGYKAIKSNFKALLEKESIRGAFDKYKYLREPYKRKIALLTTKLWKRKRDEIEFKVQEKIEKLIKISPTSFEMDFEVNHTPLNDLAKKLGCFVVNWISTTSLGTYVKPYISSFTFSNEPPAFKTNPTISESNLSQQLADIYLSQDTFTMFCPGTKDESPELKIPLEEFHTSLTVIKESKNLSEKNHTNHRKEKSSLFPSPPSQPSKIPLELKALFDLEQLKVADQKRILCLGSAGTGKSTLCQQIVYQWAKGTLWPHVIPLWVKLKNLKEEDILDSFLQRECKIDYIYKLLNEYKFKPLLNKTLLILDGYDELPLTTNAQKVFEELIDLFPHILLTSRPQPVNFEYECRLELGGLNTDQISHYIDLFFDHYDKKSEKKSEKPCQKETKRAETLHLLLAQQLAVRTWAHIPLYLNLLCVLAVDNEKDLNPYQSQTLTSLHQSLFNRIWAEFCQQPSEKISSICGQEEKPEIPKEIPLMHALEEIAWDSMQKNKRSPSKIMIEICCQRQGLKIESIHKLGLLTIEGEKGRFIPSTFQEFLSARYLVRFYKNNSEAAAQWMQRNRSNPLYSTFFSMATDIISYECPDQLSAFTKDLCKPPYSFPTSHALTLFSRCFAECQFPGDKLPAYESLIK